MESNALQAMEIGKKTKTWVKIKKTGSVIKGDPERTKKASLSLYNLTFICCHFLGTKVLNASRD